MVDVCVKRAELSTNHHLVVCILGGLNHLRNKETIQSTKSIQNKVELLADKKVRHTFASKVASLFKKHPDYTEDVESKWDFFKSAVITSTAASCGCKHVGGQMGSEKRTGWWNQEVKEAIRAKKTVFRAWLTNKLPEQLQL